MPRTRPVSYSPRADRARAETHARRRREMPAHLLRYPDTPANLPADERDAWKLFRAAIEPFDIVTAADFAAVESLVASYVHVRHVRTALRARAPADLAACELATHLFDAERRLRMWLVHLGLTAPQVRYVWAGFGLPPARAGLPENRHG